MARWMAGAGQRMLQLLPINEMPPGETSPYSALSAMAIDPQFITLDAVEDFAALGGEAALEPALRGRLETVRITRPIDYATVRALKQVALRRSFAHFRERELASSTSRATAFQAWREQESWWLAEYSLFRALHAHYRERAWTEWPEPIRAREAGAVAAAREELGGDVLFREYVQWLAAEQWALARTEASEISLFGDLPFMVSADSADVWCRQDEFRLDASTGVPPDAFSETGQDWGLPVYRWDVLAARDFDWLRNRARRNAELFDGYRVDHLVGFYRTFYRAKGEAAFVPATQPEQLALGERVLGVFREPGSEIIAEDLGVVPDFVRKSLSALDVPGYRVLRWERRWREDGQPFKDPREYPAVAVATSGTHDTEPMVVWWEGAPIEERRAVLEIESVRDRLAVEERARALDAATLPAPVRDALLEALFSSGANLLLLPIQDVFGWRNRINQPATVSDENWTWQLPWPSDRLAAEPEAVAVATRLKEWAARHGR
jgi:4-alpha-glucanotransferase